MRPLSICVLSFFLLIGFSLVISYKKKKKKSTLPSFLNFRRSTNLRKFSGYIFALAETAHYQDQMKRLIFRQQEDNVKQSELHQYQVAILHVKFSLPWEASGQVEILASPSIYYLCHLQKDTETS